MLFVFLLSEFLSTARLMKYTGLEISLHAAVNQFGKNLFGFKIVVLFGLNPFVC